MASMHVVYFWQKRDVIGIVRWLTIKFHVE